MKSLPLYTSFLFSLSLNDDIVDTEKTDGICSPAFVVNDFWPLFWHQSRFQKIKIFINNKWFFMLDFLY